MLGRASNILLILLAAVAVSCNNLTPAGFWTSYRQNSIVDKSSDQGPWGGGRWIHWESGDSERFQASEALGFAGDNGWTCDAPTPYSADRMGPWVGRDGPVFPLFFGEPRAEFEYSGNDDFPRNILTDSVIARCETGWVRVAPGTNESSPAFGYIHVSSDGHRMAVYHLWGDV